MKLGDYREGFQICAVTFGLLRDEAKGVLGNDRQETKNQKRGEKRDEARFFRLAGYINGRSNRIRIRV
jgi:hypothetical protein